ncbi:uncharacterized protein LOC122648866 isoform X2 [Telopea speciosissima]|uniref:uncharacterized protein LOC122648866 isoform X2 n=1 Tax=Telopea speciosissima TaxID=54955 RepID=UPI001CC50060|nr:uncharacterized protein LOC122648866 isoform X2 [Telopea speciosissima]
MAEICQKCGDKGYLDCLIYCSQCKVAVEHLYCLDNRPDRDVYVTWLCEQCAPRSSSPLNRLSLHPVRRSKRLRIRKRKKIWKRKDVLNFSKTETNVQNCDSTALQSHNLCLKGDTQMNEDMPDPSGVTTDPLPCKGNYDQHFSDGNHEGAKESKKLGRKLILDDEEISEEDTGSAEDRNSPVAPDVRNAPFGISSHKPSPEHGYYGPAQPVIDPVWRGCFSMCNEKSRKEVGVVAHLSNKACFKVLEGTNALPVFLGLEMLPRPYAWPKSFSRMSPTDDNIGLYFFPESKRDKAVFNWLLYEIIDRDLALKFVTDNAELLIFSSLQLPPLFQRFHGECYLWGVFRGKQVSHPPQPAEHLLIRDSGIECDLPSMTADDFGSQKGRCPSKTWSQWSPLSPFSSYGSGSPHSPLHQKAKPSGFSVFACPDIIEKAVDNEQDLEKQNAYEKVEERHAYEKQHEYEEGEVKMKDCDVVLLHSGGPWLDSLDASKENIGFEGSCLELFPLEMEDIAVVSKARGSSDVDLELALGRSGWEDSKSRSPGCKQLISKCCTLGLSNTAF